MIIHYDDEITKQRFIESSDVLRAFGFEVQDGNVLLGEIDNPGAAMDNHAMEKLPNGQIISSLFSHPEVQNVSVYDGTFNHWFKLEGTWPATIDTIAHLRGQRESSVLSKATDVLDIACGNGMAGIYAANKNHNIKRLDFSDVNSNSVQSAKRNLVESYGASPNGVVGEIANFVGDGFSQIGKQNKYDVIIASAIPATPGYEGLNRPLNPLFEGTDLLEKILRDSPKHLNAGGKLIISHSSCGEEEFDELASQYGANVDRVLYERNNAYRVEFLNNQNWVNFLVEKGGLMKKDERGFPYWHNVKVKEISF